METNKRKRVNLSPDFWGPSMWKSIHSVVAGFPEKPTIEEVNALTNFFDSLKYLIPCAKCRVHYEKNFKSMPPLPVYSKPDLMRWSYDLHNEVDKMLGKKEYPYNKFLTEYSITVENYKNENYQNVFQNKKKTAINLIIIFSVISLILILVFCNLKNDRKK